MKNFANKNFRKVCPMW